MRLVELPPARPCLSQRDGSVLFNDGFVQFARIQVRPLAKARASRPASRMQRPTSSRKASSQRQTADEAPSAAPAVQEQGNLAPLRAAPATGRSMEATLSEEVYMDQIIQKLQLLNYERDFCKRKKPYRNSLTPNYFAVHQGAGANEQFFYFTSLAAWLLQLCGTSIPTPKEFEDPNATLHALLQAMRSLGFANPSYPPTKLSSGHGKEVCAMIDGLLDMAIERKGVVVRKPVYSIERVEEDTADEDIEDDSADIATMAAQAAADESEEEEAAWGHQSLGITSATAKTAAAEPAPEKQLLVATVDPMQWKLEVESVGPKLRITLAADTRDWRQHLEAAHSNSQLLGGSWPEARAALEKLVGEVGASVEKIDSRERQLNSQFEGMLGQYQDTRQQLVAAQDDYNRATEQISERNNELHRLAVALDDVMQQLDNKGSNLSDASPLVRLKAAMSSLKTELRQMELRIGVVSHNLISLSLRDKQAALKDAARRQQAARDAGSITAY